MRGTHQLPSAAAARLAHRRGPARELHPQARGLRRRAAHPRAAARGGEASRPRRPPLPLRPAALPALHALPLSTPARRLALRHAPGAQPLLRLRAAAHLARGGGLLPLVFLDGTDAPIDFPSRPRTPASTWTCRRPGGGPDGPSFDAHEARLSSKTDYRDAQQLGRELREAGVEACVFTSARTLERARNVALFEPAFATSRPPQPAGLDLLRHPPPGGVHPQQHLHPGHPRLSPGAVRGGGRAADPGTLRGRRPAPRLKPPGLPATDSPAMSDESAAAQKDYKDTVNLPKTEPP